MANPAKAGFPLIGVIFLLLAIMKFINGGNGSSGPSLASSLRLWRFCFIPLGRDQVLSLTDKDRIFTNLYGFQDWGLKAAQARGDWDDTKALLALGPDAIIEVMKASGPARARRGRVPDRPQMELHAQGTAR